MGEKLSNKANSCNNFLFKSQNYYLKMPKMEGVVPKIWAAPIILNLQVNSNLLKFKYEQRRKR